MFSEKLGGPKVCRVSEACRPVARAVASGLAIVTLLAATPAAIASLGGPPAMFDATRDPVLRDAQAAARDAAAHRQAERESPEAIDRRRRSRTRFRGLDASGAARAAREHFRGLLAVRVGAPGSVLGGRKIRRHVSESLALLEDDTGRPDGVLYSSEPLATASGTPLDLRLRRRDGYFEPTAAAVGLRIPVVAGDAVQLPASGVGFVAVGAGRQPAVEQDGSLIFPNAYGDAADVDYVLKALPAGVEAFWQLRSPASPETFRLRYSVSGGDARLIQEGLDPARSIAIKREEMTIGRVLPAWAVDAAGQMVPVEMKAAGSEVVLTVRHRNADVEYPLLLDPQTVSEGWSADQWDPAGTGSCGYRPNLAVGWSFENAPRGGAGFLANCYLNATDWGWGVWSSVQGGQWYNDGAFAQHNWRVPRDTYIDGLAIAGINHAQWSSRANHGVYDDACPCWVVNQTLAHDVIGHYAEWSHGRANAPAPRENTRVVIGLLMSGAGTRPYATAGARAVSVALSETHRPEITIREPRPSEGWTNSRYGSVSYELHDRGLGLKGWAVEALDGRITSAIVDASCGGPRVPCPLYGNSDAMGGLGQPNGRLPFDHEVVGEGTHAMRLYAVDVAGNRATSDSDSAPQPVWYARYDKTPPQLGDVYFETPGENLVQLQWDAAVDPPAKDGSSAGVAGYRVRWRVGGADFVPWQSYEASVRETPVLGPYPAGTRVEYQIVATDAAGNAAEVNVSDEVEGDGPEVATDGQLAEGSYAGPGFATVGVSAEDTESGVQAVRVTKASGEVLDEDHATCSGSCPASFSADLTVSLSDFPEGPVLLRAEAVDARGNDEASEDVELILDRTPPPAPTNIRQVGGDDTSVLVSWSHEPDADIDPDTPGSGHSHMRFRSQRNGGSFSPWATTGDDASIGAGPGDNVTVEVQAVDQAGNHGPVAKGSFTVVPEALLTADPQMIADSQATSMQDHSGTHVEPAGQEEYEQDGEPDAQTPEATAQDEESAREDETATASFANNCTPNIDYVRSATEAAKPRHFVPERTRLGARLYILCAGVGGSPALPAGTDRVTFTAAFAYRVYRDDGARSYREIGPRRVVDFGTPEAYRPVYRKGAHNFCIPASGGRKKYVLKGVLKYHRGSDGKDLAYRRITSFNREKEMLCPTAPTRRFREAHAYSRLAKYHPDLADDRRTSPSRQLRRVLGEQPHIPSAAKRNAWDAHHIIPTNDHRARHLRALSFRCGIHPNEDSNGIYLRGSGLRKTRAGRKTRAFRQLEQYDRETGNRFHMRAYHADTFRNLYFELLTGRASAVLANSAERCPVSNWSLSDVLREAEEDLARSAFGVEQPGR